MQLRAARWFLWLATALLFCPFSSASAASGGVEPESTTLSGYYKQGISLVGPNWDYEGNFQQFITNSGSAGYPVSWKLHSGYQVMWSCRMGQVPVWNDGGFAQCRVSVCASGLTLAGDGLCYPPMVCSRGDEVSLIWKVGWAVSDSKGGYTDDQGGKWSAKGTAVPPTSACYSGCQLEGAVWASPDALYLDPAGSGNTRALLQGVNYAATGATCNGSDPQRDIAGPPPDSNYQPPKGDTPPTSGGLTGNGAAGSSGSGGSGGGSGGSGTGTDKPGSVTGSSTTTHADGSKSTTEINLELKMPQEKFEGSPDGTKATDAYGAALDALQSKLGNDVAGVANSYGINLGLPSWLTASNGSCAPTTFGSIHGESVTLDWCPAVPYARAASGVIWMIGMFFAFLALIRRTTAAVG